VFGYVFAESGTGEHTRLLIEAIRATGIPYVIVPYTRTELRQEFEFGAPVSSDPLYVVNIVGVNADQFPTFVRDFGVEVLEDRYTIGLWA